MTNTEHIYCVINDQNTEKHYDKLDIDATNVLLNIIKSTIEILEFVKTSNYFLMFLLHIYCIIDYVCYCSKSYLSSIMFYEQNK